MKNIKVEIAQITDIKELAKVQTESWKYAFESILSKEVLQKHTDLNRCINMFESVFNSNTGTFYIAYLNNNPCGMLFWRDTKNNKCIYSEIVALHTLRNSWGKGVGKALIDRALDDIYKSGKNDVFLWVFKNNYRARKFYEKCNFKYSEIEKLSRFDNVSEVKYTLNQSNKS